MEQLLHKYLSSYYFIDTSDVGNDGIYLLNDTRRYKAPIYGINLLNELNHIFNLEKGYLQSNIDNWALSIKEDVDLEWFWLQEDLFNFPISHQIAARTVGLDLVSVQPMDGPVGQLLYLDYEYEFSDKLSIQAGIRFSNFIRLGKEMIREYETGNPLSYNSVSNTYDENNLIGTINYNSGESIKQFNNFEPRISMRYLIDDNKSIKASFNRMYQYIHLVTNTTSPTPLDIWTPSGPYIKPQSADQFSFGYFSKLKESKYDFSIETYYKKLSNVTDFKEGADLLFREDIETQVIQGIGRAYGLEFQLNKNEGKLTGWLSYTLSRSENKINGINNNEYYANNADQLHRLNLVGFYKTNSRWEFGSVFTFSTGRPVTYPTGRYEQNGLVVADYSDRNGNRLPVYHRLDVSATLNPKKGTNNTGKWIFSIANLYNRQNAASIYFREVSEVNDIEIATGNTEATKLSFFGIVPSVTYEFKF
jgi:hypothetical protein